MKNQNIIKIKDYSDFWTLTYSNGITGDVVEMRNGSAIIKELFQEKEIYFWIPKSMVSCNPNMKVGYSVEVQLVSDSVAHRLYVNPFNGNEKYFVDYIKNSAK